MAYIEVDVDLDEFDTHEIVSECIARLNPKHWKKLSGKQQKEMNDLVIELCDELGITNTSALPVKTLDDQIKIEHLSKVFNKYTSTQIEQMLPE